MRIRGCFCTCTALLVVLDLSVLYLSVEICSVTLLSGTRLFPLLGLDRSFLSHGTSVHWLTLTSGREV
jgi:hypothetical protein